MHFNWDKISDALINKCHVAIATVCQGAIFVAHWKFGKDLSPGVQSTVNWFYLFLAGHFTSSQVWPDKSTGDPNAPPPAEPGASS